MSEHDPMVIVLNEDTRFGSETGAGIMRNRCAFTVRDMGDDWPAAFTYAVVLGWNEATAEMAARWDWDDEMVAFLQDAHARFTALADKDST